jgi:uncharacterized protein
MKEKITLHSEIMYFIAITILAFAVALAASTNLGVSMIVAPAYILSLKFTFLSFGQWEYVFQGCLFILFCIIMRKFKLWYLGAFLTCLIYGAVLDLFRKFIPFLNPSSTLISNMSLAPRILFFSIAIILTGTSLAIFFRIYLCPQVYDFFVRELCKNFNLNRTIFKTCFDATFFLTGCILSLCFFKKFNGIGIGTLVMTLVNGSIINLCGKIFDKFFVFKPLFSKLEKFFQK